MICTKAGHLVALVTGILELGTYLTQTHWLLLVELAVTGLELSLIGLAGPYLPVLIRFWRIHPRQTLPIPGLTDLVDFGMARRRLL